MSRVFVALPESRSRRTSVGGSVKLCRMAIEPAFLTATELKLGVEVMAFGVPPLRSMR